MSILSVPLLTPDKVKTHALVETYKLQALSSMYPELAPTLTPLVKFCERAKRKFQTDPQFAPCKAGGHSHETFTFGAGRFNAAVLKAAAALVPGGLPEDFFANIEPPVDNSVRIEEIERELAVLRKQISSLQKERSQLREQSGIVSGPSNNAYMREYMRKRRAQQKGETNV